MTKRKNKDKQAPALAVSLNPSPDSTPHINQCISDAITSILSTTQTYSKDLHSYINARFLTASSKPHMKSFNNLFLISTEEFNEAARLLSTNSRLLTILSLSFNLRFPFAYAELSTSLPLSISLLSLLWHNLPKRTAQPSPSTETA